MFDVLQVQASDSCFCLPNHTMENNGELVAFTLPIVTRVFHACACIPMMCYLRPELVVLDTSVSRQVMWEGGNTKYLVTTAWKKKIFQSIFSD